MAPVTATAVGMLPQTIDDPKLKGLMARLNNIPSDRLSIPVLIDALKETPTWYFEEQADLYEWIPLLNAIDSALTVMVKDHPGLLLVARKQDDKQKDNDDVGFAKSMEDVTMVPDEVVDSICVLLRFLSTLLRNSTNKAVFNSVQEVADLLAAANDTVVTCALDVLRHLATPPALHKQQAPELHQHSTNLHSRASQDAHSRLLSLARGWGTRGSGLGLFPCVTADDSEYGQGALPQQAGELQFEFYADGKEHLVRLTMSDICQQPCTVDDRIEDDDTTTSSKQKRRRLGTGGIKTKSSAELFFACVDQAGGHDVFPQDKLFDLLTDVRLARAFYSTESRVMAVKNRLRALIAILHSHPSQEIMSGYFQAQPELCVEVIDLLRPTVSSASVSAAAARPKVDAGSSNSDNMQVISALANSPQVPYNVRTLAVEALTAFVSRRDGASGGITVQARQSSVLGELGVGKGLYLGLLPTLIRYSLASLTAFLRSADKRSNAVMEDDDKGALNIDADDAIGMDLGLAFVKATKPAMLPAATQIHCALEFVDSVLTLTSSVVAAPSGTAALTDCGLIPALLNTVAADSQRTPGFLSDTLTINPDELSHAQSLLRFITAQSVQIIEGAIVTHNNALSAFHDLQGVEVLVSRLSTEIDRVRDANETKETTSETAAVPMETDDEPNSSATKEDVKMADAKGEISHRSMQSSQRVLLFSIVNCMTVVFHHQESATTAATSPLGGTELRKPELTRAVKEILEHADSYGGVLVALVSSLLSDVMNSDPQVVHHVHNSGIAKSFLRMLMGDAESAAIPSYSPVAPVQELLMAIPNVLSALSLTEDGATALIEMNPFPALLSLFYNPDYAMPKSRCVLNEMTSIVGTGLDEIMRHVPRHRPLVMSAIVNAMCKVKEIGSSLMEREESSDMAFVPGETPPDISLEQERSNLMQYAMNFGHMLEQILHNEEHCAPFVNSGGLEAGGLTAILDLFPYLMPTGSQFLAQASCLSCPSLCTLSHASTEDSLTIAFKCVALHYDPRLLLSKMMQALEKQLNFLEAALCNLRNALGNGSQGENALSAAGILESLPRVPLHEATESAEFRSNQAGLLSRYLRSVVIVQWLSNLLAIAIRAASQRSAEMESGWGRNEREWKKILTSPSFEKLVGRLSLFCQSSILEACRIRTEDGFESRDRDRLNTGPIGQSRVRYRVRIVCQEGAIVRNGIEIDSSASVGSVEMGEVSVAYDRCLNSSGVMRYRTQMGWVSELTRGHGREPIAEVLSVWNAQDDAPPESHVPDKANERHNCGIADVCSMSASILARSQSSYSEVFASLSRVATQSFKVIPVRTVSFEPGTAGHHVKNLLHILASNIQEGFNKVAVTCAIDKASAEPPRFDVNDAGVSIYLGALLSQLHSCLFEEKRERRMLNVPLLLSLVIYDDSYFLRSQEASEGTSSGRPLAILQALQFVFRQSLSDLRSSVPSQRDDEPIEEVMGAPHLFVSRSVAASLPPAVSLMQRLMSGTLITSSSLTSVLSRLSDADLSCLMNYTPQTELSGDKNGFGFRSDYMAKAMKCAVSDTLFSIWQDPKFIFAPAHIVHPVASLVVEVISTLEDESKQSRRSSETEGSERGQWNLFSRSSRRRGGDDRNAGGDDNEHNFEPSEEIISQLVDMGFSREQALDALENTRSNRIDVAMEYALTSGHLNPARRRSERRDVAAQVDAANGAGDGEQNEASHDETVRDEEMIDSDSNAEGGAGQRDKTHGKSDDGAGAEKTKANFDELLSERVKNCLRAWASNAPNVALNVISGGGVTCSQSDSSGVGLFTAGRRDDGKGRGDAEAEALTVVLTSFLLNVCQRFPDELTTIVLNLVDRLKSNLSQSHQGSETAWGVLPENACSFASLCHTAVLFTRALPLTRLLILKRGLVRCLISSIETFIASRTAAKVTWPMWLAPSLLLLDVMAQPVTSFSDDSAGAEDNDIPSGDFAQVRDEHKQQAAAISKTADAVFTVLREAELKGKEEEENGDAVVDRPEGAGNSGTADSRAKPDSEKASKKSAPFSSVPPYLPLLPSDSARTCMLFCLELLGKGRSDKGMQPSHPPPGIVQAILLLLTRLLRSPKMASQCLHLGAAELILSLPRDCRFNGAAGVVTVILRRLLEDEATLQSTMAAEIRYALTKINGERSAKEKPRVPIHAFIQAVMPLICRDPTSFLKAAATTICIESKEYQSNAQNTMVVLLSPERSSRNSRALADLFSAKDMVESDATGSGHEKRGSRTSNVGKAQRAKHDRRSSSKRSSPSRKSKKERAEESGKKGTPLNGTPVNHVSCLMIARIASLANEGPESTGSVLGSQADRCGSCRISPFGESSSFLWLADALEIMADLVLAVPACAAAIHKYRTTSTTRDRSSRGSPSLEISHALSGSPNPPRTFVNFLLHNVLPQDRWSYCYKRERQARDRRNDDDESAKAKRKMAHLRCRVAQTSARLLVSLVARTGEGRRRVIADLTFALSGGRLGHASPGSSATKARKSDEHEFYALQSWADLCIGLAAPRSNGLNFDSTQVLSMEVVKLMLDHGMAHALMYSLHRVRLQHPMASNTCRSLLVPLEVFTRGSVSDAVQSLADKEALSKEKKVKQDEAAGEPKTSRTKKSSEPSISQRSESLFADDTMLDDGFDAHAAARSSHNRAEDAMEDEDVEYEMMAEDEEDADSNGEEIEMEEADESIESDSVDEAISSDESGATEDLGEEIQQESVDEDEESDESEDNGEDFDVEEEDEEEEEDFRWDEGNPTDFLNAGDDQANDEGLPNPGDSEEMEEGWTRVETNGNMIYGNRRRVHLSARNRGFIDAAEAMIGSLLRTGEIDNNALGEIEATLGIRIMPQNRGSSAFENADDGENPLGPRAMGSGPPAPARNSNNSAVVTVPHVYQRTPPDSGYSAIGGGLRWNEIGSMEYVYGGPSVAAGNRNYDVASNRPLYTEADTDPTPSQVNSCLFPGGPAAATHARAQQSQHPLLCGVELPPVNALVSDLLPMGVRATYRSQTSARRPADSRTLSSGGYLVSTSTGNVVRLNRGAQRGPFDFGADTTTSRTSGGDGLVGWTDDGLPFESTVGEFRSAFERALGESMLVPEPSASQPQAVSSAEGGMGQNPIDLADSTESNLPAGNEVVGVENSSNVVGEAAASSASDGDGDGVASSLAEGLRLSPRSDRGNSFDHDMGAAIEPPDEAPEQEHDASEAASDPRQDSTRTSLALDEAPLENAEIAALDEGSPVAPAEGAATNGNELACPPGMDQEVFSCLPIEMQREVVEQHRTAAEVAGQLDSASGLDPEALAALPEDMRREVIEHEQRERRLREQAPADPSNAEEMDNASFIASLSPELREEILLTADEGFLHSLPPNIIAEAQVLRERASAYHRRPDDGSGLPVASRHNETAARSGVGETTSAGSSKRKRSGKMKLECNRSQILYLPEGKLLSSLMGFSDLKALVRLMYLRSPIRPQRTLNKLFQNLCGQSMLRNILTSAFVQLLNDNCEGAVAALKAVLNSYDDHDWRKKMDDEFEFVFPPNFLIGSAPEVHDSYDYDPSMAFFRQRQDSNTAASIAANLPSSAKGSRDDVVPPLVRSLTIDTLVHLSKTSPRVCIDALLNGVAGGESLHPSDLSTCFDKLVDLLEKPRYAKSSSNLEHLLGLIEIIVSPLSLVPTAGDAEHKISQRDIDTAASSGKEYVDVPRIVVSQTRLKVLCSILRMESCKDTAFTKVNSIARRLCRVEANRGCILGELGAVAQSLAADAIRDLRTLNIRMQDAASAHQGRQTSGTADSEAAKRVLGGGGASSSVTLSISSSELKLLRVLQTLQSLCVDTTQEDGNDTKNEGNVIVTEQLIEIFEAMRLDDLWIHLDSCLHIVKVLEGVSAVEEIDENDNAADDASDDNGPGGKKLQNSVAGLLTRFLPIIEAFFVVNASARRTDEATPKEIVAEDTPSPAKTDGIEETAPAVAQHPSETVGRDDAGIAALVGGTRLIEFVTANRVLLNALVRNNPGLLEKGLRAMVQVPRCRALLDFDVKRHWFKTQVRRLRQHASRHHGSLRLSIRRAFVFEDAYHQLRLRNADEMRGRLHITFRNEEGVDAGGLSREFFGILAKEIFNPNYALFTSTEDGCTFQPNPNSSINPDHLSYFRFVGRIVGKAVADGFLLDAYFTRSLYKHMLGRKPTYHDMEAIDPDYYKNLQMILEHNLADIGLDLTFSIEDYSFGRNQIIDLLPGGRNVPVTEDTKEKYVSLVCQHRMTTAISSQIQAYLDGFYELVSRDLIAIFTPRELELLISGLPDIDVHDLRQNTEYQGYRPTDKEIQWFWNVLFGLSRSEKAAFLQFVTGSSKVPLAGFSELQGMRGVQKFSIHKAGGSSGALMSAHTCFNSLDLPVYKSEEETRQKLLYSINEGQTGFAFA